ncbi:hypothetical protein MTYP_01691 [Methylophilaceae bacterium]|nr:hypothetical protein MTYP_01691 [Methylophilaceae bacterium]
MKPIQEFSLEQHGGPYEQRPLQSRLLHHGRPTGILLPGYVLLRQFITIDGGYLLITDWDCPFEEMTYFTLLGRDFRIRSSRRLGGMAASFLLTGFEVVTDSAAIAIFGRDKGHDLQYLVKIRKLGIPYFLPKISIKKI